MVSRPEGGHRHYTDVILRSSLRGSGVGVEAPSLH